MSTRVYYLRDQFNIHTKKNGYPSKGNPIVCIVSEFSSDTHQLKYGYSAYHPDDQFFTKSRARMIAQGRLNKKPMVIEDVQAKTNHELNKVMIADIAKMEANFSKPKRFVELAKEWLSMMAKEDTTRNSDSNKNSKEVMPIS